jgi:AcrR family transcriptional regulator
MNVAAVNYHFGDKEKLYIEAVRQAHCASTPPMRMPEWPAKTSPVEKLRIYIRQTLTQMNKPLRPTALGLLMRELSHPSPITQQIVEDFIRPMAHGLFEILREVLPQLSDRHRLLIGLSIVGQCLYYRQNREVTKLLFGDSIFEELSTEILVDHVTRFTLAALGLEKPYPKLILKDLEKGGG